MLDADSTFATVKILRVWQERLREIDWRGARAEGYRPARRTWTRFTEPTGDRNGTR